MEEAKIVEETMDAAVEAVAKAGMPKGGYFGIGLLVGGLLVTGGVIVKKKFFDKRYAKADVESPVNPDEEF